MSTYTSPNGPLADRLDSWASQVQQVAKTLRNRTSEPTMDDLLTVSSISRGLREASQSPEQHMLDMFINSAQFVAARLFLKWNVFSSIPSSGHISYRELAEKVGADENLISESSL